MGKTFLIFLLLFTAIGHAQFSDLAKIDYTNISGSNSDTKYNRTRVLLNYPIKLKKESTYLFLGLDYSNINLEIEENLSFDSNELNDFRILDLNIGYTTPLKNDWRLGVRLTPGFSSNLSSKELGIQDIVFSSDVVFVKDKTKDKSVNKPWRLILGGSYSGNRGFPFPLPFINFYKKFHHNWSYTLGVPRANLEYHRFKKHRIKLYTELDGFTVNLQRGVLIDNTTVAESINMSIIVSGLQYEFYITKHIRFYAKSGYNINNSVNLRDSDRDNILELDNTTKLYLRTGLRFKI